MGDENELDALPSKEQRAIEKRIRMAEEQVSTKKALVKKSEQSRLRLWRWWFECNEEALRARMEFGPEGLFPLQGKRSFVCTAERMVSVEKLTQMPAGEKKLEQRGFAEGITDEDNTLLELASAPSTITQAAHMSVATKPNSRPAGLSELGTRPVDTVQESDSYFDRDFGRSIDGKVIADYELASTRPLTTVPLLFCMSDSIIKYVDRKGETLETALSLGNAAKAYFAQLGSDATLLRRLEARFDDLSRYRVIEEIEEDEQRVAHLLNERQFCKDRVAIWDLLVRATEEYFEIFGGELHVSFDTWLGKAVMDVVEAVRDYAEGSKDRETVAYITEYLEGDI